MPADTAKAEALLRRNTATEGEESIFDGADLSPEVLPALAALVPGSAVSTQGGIDLRAKDLSGVSLRSAVLTNADLRGANLTSVRASGVRLNGASLEAAQFEGADLVGANLSACNAGEANFRDAMMEDAQMVASRLRFAVFEGATLEGADLSDSDLWGARFEGAIVDHVNLKGARLDESNLVQASLQWADLSRATLRRANMHKAQLHNVNLKGAVLDGSDLSAANLSGASLPNLSLVGCNLDGAHFAGAWLDRTRMRASQLGGTVGEERSGNLTAAVDSYLVLEQNFTSLGNPDDARWAYLRRRRVGKRLHLAGYKASLQSGKRLEAVKAATLWVSDILAEWLCDYGESLLRVARAFLCILVGFAIVYWLTSSLGPRDGFTRMHLWTPVNYLLFSLDSMTTVGTSEVALRPNGELGVLLSSIQTVIGTVLLGLFGFVLGARIRN